MLVLNGIGIVGRLSAARLADKFGPLNVMAPMTLVTSILCFAWMGVKTPQGMYGWSAVFGIFSGCVQALFPTGVQSLSTDLSKAGLRLGMCFAVVGFCILSGPPAAGAIIERQGGKYSGLQAFAGASVMLGAGFILAARRIKVGNRLRVKI
jgi:MFS family permease